MANLLIDIGNTTLKASWAEGMTLGKTFRYQGEKKISFILSQTSKQKPEIMVISNIRSFSNQEVERLRGECGHLIIINDEVLKERNLPSYLTPDRAASIIASRYLFKGKGCTIFDFGATLTIDKIDSEGNYLGGNISLGCRTRLKALNRYSKNLPLVDFDDDIPSLGNSVQTAIKSGVISGILFEINGYLSDNSENISVFTGGDANYFAKRMKNCIFAVCNLVLMGLALIAFEYDQRN
jgi:type III pantothenate kinase